MIDFQMQHLAKAHNLLVDDTGSDIYIGYSDIKVLPGESRWSIKKISTANPITIQFAEGQANFDKVWDNRLSYSYS